MEKRTMVKLGVIVVWAGYIATVTLMVVAIANSPWFSFQYNWLSDLGNSTRSQNYAAGIRVTYIFNASLMIGGIAGMFFSHVLFTSGAFLGKKGKLSTLLFFLGTVFIFLTGLFSEDFGIVHTIVSLGLFFMVPVSLLAFSFSLNGWERKLFQIIAFCSLAAFIFLFIDRPWGSNAVVELVPCAALGIGLAVLSRKMLLETHKGKKAGDVTP
ncbi:MAG: DUF998 domain-containing protein [Thermoplasmata archaeon]|nr:DUF998 domain-containing protein [Thermoplasmata archaeon]